MGFRGLAAAHRTWVRLAMMKGLLGLRPFGRVGYVVFGVRLLSMAGYEMCDTTDKKPWSIVVSLWSMSLPCCQPDAEALGSFRRLTDVWLASL